MKRKPFIYAAFAFSTLWASAQVNSPRSNGYEARAAAMLADGNYIGCVDQCNVALKLGSERREQLIWLSALASFKGGFADGNYLVQSYIKKFPHGEHIVSARLLEATYVFYNEDYAAALALFNAINPASLSDNEREDLTYRKAYSMMKLGQYDSAMSMMQELAKTKRYSDVALFYEGYIAFMQGEYEHALICFSKCDKKRSPGNMADYYVAQILFRRADYADALNILMPLMARKNVPAEFADECERIAGECFYAWHDDNRAMVYLNSYMQHHSQDAPISTRYIVGVERYQTGDYDEALALLAPVSQLSDEMGQSAALTMGQAYQAIGNYQSAIIAFNKAANMDYNPTLTETACYNYAVAQVDGGRVPFGNTVQMLEDFIKRYPKSRYAESVREYMVRGYMSTDDYEGALRSLNAMPDNHSETIDAARQRVNFVLGTRALQASNPSKAVDYLTAAMRYGNSDAEIEKQTSLWLGDAYYALGQYRKAAVEYKSYMASADAKDPNRSIAQYNLGYAEFAERNYVAARKMFERVVADRSVKDVLKQDAYNRIGDSYYYGKELSAAKAAYSKAFSIKPSSGDYALLQIAMMDGHMGDYSAKLASLQRLVDEYPNSVKRPVALTEMALTNSLQGNSAGAIALYKKIVSSYQTTQYGRNALLQIAILTDNSGDTRSAKEYYRKVISDYPTSQEAALAVQDLKRICGDEGSILELDSYLAGIKDAPQLDAVERNAIAAASLLRRASSATSNESRLEAADKLLADYPDAAEAEEALLIAARAHDEAGVPGKALARYTELEARATSATMRRAAQVGIVRSAAELGDNARVLSASAELMDNPGSAGIDFPEVKFLRAQALSNTGATAESVALWSELADDSASIYGTRSAYELASHYFNAGDNERAEKMAESLIDSNPPHPYWLARTFILYSDILRADDKSFEADEYLRVLRSNYPGTENDIFQMIDKRLPK